MNGNNTSSLLSMLMFLNGNNTSHTIAKLTKSWAQLQTMKGGSTGGSQSVSAPPLAQVLQQNVSILGGLDVEYHRRRILARSQIIGCHISNQNFPSCALMQHPASLLSCVSRLYLHCIRACRASQPLESHVVIHCDAAAT